MAEPSCPGCRERDVLIASLLERIAALEQRVRDLEDRLGLNATNSSLPPSANPPGAAAPVVKKPSGRKTGAQPGHPPHLKQLLPPQRLTRTEVFVPARCERCQAALSAQPGPHDPPPSRHQVADLPEVRASVVEYQGH